jgi:hypothetical protein
MLHSLAGMDPSVPAHDRSASWAREPEYCHFDRAPAMIASCLNPQCRRGGYRSVWEAGARSRLLPGRQSSSRRSRGLSQPCALGFETPIGLDINPRNQLWVFAGPQLGPQQMRPPLADG